MRFLLLLLLFLGLSYSVYAQSFQSQLVLGVNASQIDGDRLWGYNKPGFLAGAMVSYPLSDLVAAQAGMMYSEKGSRHGENDLQFFIWRLNYLELPWMIRVQAFEKIYFSGGLSVNYLISSKTDIGYGFESRRTGLKDFDYCYTAAVAYQPFDRTSFQIRLTNGFNSASRYEYYLNRSLSFAVLFDLMGS